MSELMHLWAPAPPAARIRRLENLEAEWELL
jgi:hypothetical protein